MKSPNETVWLPLVAVAVEPLEGAGALPCGAMANSKASESFQSRPSSTLVTLTPEARVTGCAA